jgi:hypothetical protein
MLDATALQPGQHIGCRMPSIASDQLAPAGTGKPQ